MKKFCYASLMLLLFAPSAVVAMEGGGATNPLAASSMTVARDGQDASLAAYETDLDLMGGEEGVGAADSHNPIDMTKSTRFMGLPRDQYATPQDLEALAKKIGDGYVTREAFDNYRAATHKILQTLPTASAHPTKEEVKKQIAEAHKVQLDDLNSSLSVLLKEVKKISGGYATHQEKIEKLELMFAKIEQIYSWYALHQKQHMGQQEEIAALRQLVADNRAEYRTQLGALVRQQNHTDGVVVTMQAELLAVQLEQSAQNNKNAHTEVFGKDLEKTYATVVELETLKATVGALKAEQSRQLKGIENCLEEEDDCLEEEIKKLKREFDASESEIDDCLEEDLDNISSLKELTAHHTELINALTARVQQLMPAGQQLERSAGSDSVVQDALQQGSTAQNNNNPEYDALIQRLTGLETLVAQLQQSKAQVEAGQRTSVIGGGLLFPPLRTIDTRKIALGTGVVGAAVLVLYLKSHDMLPTKN